MVALDTALITAVISQATRLATYSWENGTLAEALLEYYNPELSVFSANAFPNGKLPTDFTADDVKGLAYAKHTIELDADTLTPDGSLGDPNSLGVSAVLLAVHDAAYASAAQRQNDHTLAGKTWDGAISHRESTTELWADSEYMVPPFLAYYAVGKHDLNALRFAARQPVKYAAKLAPERGLWQHILGKPYDQETPDDTGLWSTGNAWALAGMARVYATIKNGPFAGKLGAEMKDLRVLMKGIIDGVRSAPLADDEQGAGLVRNYIQQDQWWGEISGTSLIAAAIYRMAKLEPEMFGGDCVKWADKRRRVVWQHIGKDGIASPAVNPLAWGDFTRFTSGSPEGQAFIIMMESAKRDLNT
ncbi:hypothetical protein EJ05DRAFT_155398 [Pseudovirgaria hyperparasitica]|uniref:Six-hairpin glycosidase n=1 Tax=Pseudovirgaria hyperparasitica TaxID=470096 RepID=A0A6A6VXE5_9PEZI|nr:uncharacterized protein EJ05DRAFT_155398 [Pseudovirgaria hyperparasitica]KAF2754300.1 hypothetical protein EJ05DRAFT_155398 [Pseudovirgaria hyperparasitica]